MRSLTAALVGALVVLPATPAWAANQPPVVVDDEVTIRNNSIDGLAYAIDALADDSDPDGDTLVYTAVTPATTGEAYLQDGRLMYRPRFRTQGTDSFTYTVTDGQGNTATGTVTATLWVDPDMPGQPSITIPASGSAMLTWSAAARAEHYRIYRNRDLVHTTSGLTWTDSGLLDTSYYEYRIVGVNGGGWEGPGQGLFREERLLTPSTLAVAPIDDPTAVSLTWVSSGPGPWLVYRDGAPVATTTDPRFEESGLVTGREYSYQVQLVDRPTPFDYDVRPASLLSDAVRATPAPLSPIARLFMERGAGESDVGAVTVPERAVPGGRQQDHVNGFLAQQDGTDPYAVVYHFARAWDGAGGVAGHLGFPVSFVDCGLGDGGCVQFFEGGSVWSKGGNGPFVVGRFVEDGWAAQGWEDGPLGYPVGPQVALSSGGIRQPFEGGAVYWSAATGPHGVASPIYERYAAAGYQAGALGYPNADEVETAKGIRQSFTGGTIWWSPARGAQVVPARMASAWSRWGWAEGALGEPTAAERVLRTGRSQTFTGGSVHWSSATGARVVRGPIRTAWGRVGSESGQLRYPVTEERALTRAGGKYQTFQGGSVYWSPRTGAHALRFGPIRAAWGRSGWEKGRLGYPTTDEFGTTTTRRQRFQGGTITLDVRSGRATITYL